MKITRKIILLLFIWALMVSNSYGQIQTQVLNLKEGFNFLSFILIPDLTSQKLIEQNLSIEDIYAHPMVHIIYWKDIMQMENISFELTMAFIQTVSNIR